MDGPPAAGGSVEVAEPGLRRLRMSWEEFLELRVEGKTEWVDGEAVVSPPVGVEHGVIAVRLGVVLTGALPGLDIGTRVGVWLPGDRLRAPDLMALSPAPHAEFLREAPVLVVEVLSPSTRSEDLLRKAPEYAAAGIGQFWVVDPDARSLEVFDNVEGTLELRLRLDDADPTGQVAVGDHGVVPLDLTAILARRG